MVPEKPSTEPSEQPEERVEESTPDLSSDPSMNEETSTEEESPSKYTEEAETPESSPPAAEELPVSKEPPTEEGSYPKGAGEEPPVSKEDDPSPEPTEERETPEPSSLSPEEKESGEPTTSEEETHPPIPESPEASGEGLSAEQPPPPPETMLPESTVAESPPAEEPENEQEQPTSPEEGAEEEIREEAAEPSEGSAEQEASPAPGEEMISPEMTHVDFDLLDIEGRWLLKVLSGPNTGAEFAIHGGSSYLIGTDTQACDIVFQDLSVSRKHARLTIDVKENATLEDLKSRNGTFVDGEKIEKRPLSGNVLVSMGTTTFMLIDREAERTTIVAGAGTEGKEAVPAAAEGSKEAAAPLGPIQAAVMAPLQSEVEKVKEGERLQAKLSHAVSSLVILAVVTGLIMTIGIGGALLFRTQKVETPTVVNPETQISKTLNGFPAIRYSYNPTTNRLLLVGHVATATDRSRMLDVVSQLKFIRDIDYNNVVIDDRVWGEFNQVLAKNPAWRGISVTSPSAGRFVLTGFLRTRAQAEELYDYVSQNFPYVDLLERRVVVEEELLGQITRELNEAGFQGVTPSLSGGTLTLAGSIGLGTKERFGKLVTVFRSLPGIRSVQVLVSEAGQKEAVVDLTSKYSVTGYSKAGNKVSVVINGRILAPGDTLDGMLITEITQTRVFLEKGGVKYKIDFNS